MDRQEQVSEVVSFIQDHPESTASLAILRQVLGTTDPANVDLEQLQTRLMGASDTLLGYCYYLVK
ncbi:MAG: hypothetical protein AB1445_14765 [Bacillota bacterium]